MFQRIKPMKRAWLALLAVALVATGMVALPVVMNASPTEALSSSDTADYLDALNDIHALPYDVWTEYYDYLRTDGDLDWVDWSQDGCSFPVTTPWHSDFLPGCLRHDMTWRTLPIIDDGDGRIWNQRNRYIADQQFLDDNYAVCLDEYPIGTDRQNHVFSTCITAAWGFYGSVRGFQWSPSLTADETSSVSLKPMFVEYPETGAVDCTPPGGRCLPVQFMTVDGQPLAPQNIPYVMTNNTVKMKVTRAHTQFGKGPPTSAGLSVYSRYGVYRPIGEITLKVKYPLRAEFDNVVSCETRGDQTLYIDSGTYRPSKNAEDKAWRHTNIYVKACRDTTTSEEDDDLIEFRPRMGRYVHGRTDLQYKNGFRSRHYENFVADACRTIEVDYPQRIAGRLMGTDCLSTRDHGGYADFYSFDLSETTMVQINMKQHGEDYLSDPYLYLLRGDSRTGSKIAENDDVDGGRNSEIVQSLGQGSYTVVATNYGEDRIRTGSYVLEIKTSGTCYATPLWRDVTEGEWESDDCDSFRRSGSYADRYTFVVEEPEGEASTRAVRIDLDSGVDAYLYLLSGNNPSGTSYLAYDDNNGPGSDARITENLAPGTYTIVATTRDAGRKDDYTLRVSGHR